MPPTGSDVAPGDLTDATTSSLDAFEPSVVVQATNQNIPKIRQLEANILDKRPMGTPDNSHINQTPMWAYRHDVLKSLGKVTEV